MKIGVYGGSFNPIHTGHYLSVHYALAVGNFDYIVIVPCGQHAFSKELIPFEHRFKMCVSSFIEDEDFYAQYSLKTETAIIRSKKNDKIIITNIEDRKETSYTYFTIQRLKDELPDLLKIEEKIDFSLIVGSDCIAQIDDWDYGLELKKEVDFFVLPRDTEFSLCSPLSSSLVRERILAGEDISRLVPRSVREYIQNHKLYYQMKLWLVYYKENSSSEGCHVNYSWIVKATSKKESITKIVKHLNNIGNEGEYSIEDFDAYENEVIE